MLAEPRTADEIRALLASDKEFNEQFKGAIVNTVGDTVGGKASRFSIRVKLTDTQREKFDADRTANPIDYQPPYFVHLRRVLGGLLVPEAFSDNAIFPNQARTLDFAEIKLHFVQDVAVSALREKLAILGNDVIVRTLPDEQAESGRNFKIEFGVSKETDPGLLFTMVQSRLAGLTGTGGQPVDLSNPIPESSEIGGRMVGELRSAAINALVIAMFAIVMYIRVRFHEYKFGIAGVVALVHDVLVTLGFVVVFNYLGLIEAELDLSMIAAFLTIIGYSINDTIVIFDRVRENLSDAKRLGSKIDRAEILNRSLNQTLSRTILTVITVMIVVIAQFVVNFHTGTTLEGFSFALLIGMISGTYSTLFIAAPIVLWFWERERASDDSEVTAAQSPVGAVTASSGS